MTTMSTNDTSFVKIILIGLFIPLAHAIDQLITSLHPELHLIEWLAAMTGAFAGQIFYRADRWYRVIGGLFVGFTAALFLGPDLAARYDYSANAGRFATAGAADMIVRVIEYFLRHPGESADFLADKMGKLMSVFGSSIVERFADWFGGFFKKKP
jgi:hypothetical protein